MDHLTVHAVRTSLKGLGLGLRKDSSGYTVFCMDRRVSKDTIHSSDLTTVHIRGIKFAHRLKKETSYVRPR